MNKLNVFGLVAILILAAQVTHANVNVSFVETAPKDRFVFTNSSQCTLEGLEVTIDISGSAGGLIFDTTSSGVGVEVFQPFEVRSGNIALNTNTEVKDGDTNLSVLISSIEPNGEASFTIDVDDTLRNSELGMIQVTGSEIKNGTVTVMSANGMQSTGVFGGDSKANIEIAACT